MRFDNISIGIVLYKNDKKEIEDCLSGIASQTAVKDIREVLLRNQGGGECIRYVDEWVLANRPSFDIKVSSGSNLGFGGGHNAIFTDVGAESVAYLCINPDGIMHPRCLEKIIGCAVQNEWKGVFEAIQEPVMHPKRYDPKNGVTDWCSGACVLIPSSIYKEIGGFDEDYFLYCEDVDLSWRVKALGYQCFTCSEAWFFHYAMDRTARVLEIWRSACILAHKWRSISFKNHALDNLASLTDVGRDELKREAEKYSQHSLDEVFRANPNFHNKLYFGDPMWT